MPRFDVSLRIQGTKSSFPDPETQQLKPPDGPNASEDGSVSEHQDGQVRTKQRNQTKAGLSPPGGPCGHEVLSVIFNVNFC